MPRYSDELINEIFAQNDIVDYVSQYVRLKKNGRDYTGLCPFHKEKSPSFHVNQEKQLFHCFGCGAGGNLVQFVMRSEGLDFVEALKLMADRAGIILPEDDIQFDDKIYKKKKRIYEMNKAAAQIYYTALTKETEGRDGLEYLKDRRIIPNTIIRYGLGFAPDSYDYLKKRLNNQGYADDELIEAGLCVTKGGKTYDKFRARVIFPIIDLRGNVIAFGGRIINAAEKDGYKPPKYLNSAETPVFNKGKNLFSLNLAKKYSDMQCILCEGYMDVISVNQAGIQNIVATLGTALTENQARLLMKYTNEILLCYDSDEAGQAATKRAIEIITGVGGKCRVMQLRGAKDPDEYIKNNGVEMFRNVMKSAPASTEYLVKCLKGKYDLDNPDGKIMFVQEAAEVLAKIPNEVEVDAYVKKLSDETEISRDAIYSEIKKYSKRDKISAGKPRSIKMTQSSKPPDNGSKSTDAEKKLLSLIIGSKKCYQSIKDQFKPDDFSTDVLKRLAHIIYKCYEEDQPIEPAMITIQFNENDVTTVTQIFCNVEIYSNEHNTIVQLVSSIKLNRLEEDIKRAIKENDAVKLKELLDLRLKLEGKKQCQN
ncbi:MAG: DNA primase [Clostridiales bacterium]|nr:DNA primase [Clostridiales bacterium]